MPTALSLYTRALRLLSGFGGRQAAALTALSVILALVGLAEPVLFGRMIDRLAEGQAAFGTIGLWAGFGLANIATSALSAILADRLAHRARLMALNEALSAALALPPAWHAERGTGAVMRTVTAGADTLFGQWLGMMREHLAALLSLVLLVPTAIGLDARMAAILLALGLAYLAANLFVVARTRAGQRGVEAQAGRLHGRVGDVLSNVMVVQSYGRVSREMADMEGVMRDFLSAQTPVLTWWGLLSVLTRAAATLSMVAIFALGAVLAGRGEMTLGEIVAFSGFAGLVIARLDRLSAFATSVIRQAPLMSGFFELLDAGAATPDAADAQPLAQPVRGAVRFEGVSFTYPGAQIGLSDLSFTVEPGQTVALVGPTGSGKTTALALLQRLRSPDAGRILLDGQDLAQVTLASLRAAQAVVFQEAGLFNRSIAENIRLGRPQASQAEVEAAARLAEAHDFILAKPGGYDFAIGERGAALSGGERQRLALARAILKEAPLLLLDEATSALDPSTEARIKQAVDGLRAGRTTFIIAHRLSTVADADLILVFDKGRIVERGSFAALRGQNGLFADMLRAGEIRADTPAPPA